MYEPQRLKLSGAFRVTTCFFRPILACMDSGHLGTERINPGQIATVAETHFNDLQANVEAGSRQLDHIHDAAREIRDVLFVTQFEQAALMGSLVRQILDLRECLKQQRQTMRELRHDIRRLRNIHSNR
jgi:hypothetical protein